MLSAGSLVFWNKMKIGKRKTKILFFNFQIKIENWKSKKKCHFSIFNFEIKLKYTKKCFSIPILKWNWMALSVHGFSVFRLSNFANFQKFENWRYFRNFLQIDFEKMEKIENFGFSNLKISNAVSVHGFES